MTGADILLKVNYYLDDFSDKKFSNPSKWVAINLANKAVHQIASKYKPSLVNSTDTQNTVIATSEYTLSTVPGAIISVRIAGAPINSIDKETINDLTETGTPQNYYMSAYNKISLHPIPNAVTALSVYMTADLVDWTDATTIQWNQEIAELIATAAYSGLSGGDTSTFQQKIINAILGLEQKTDTFSKGYWDDLPQRGDYE